MPMTRRQMLRGCASLSVASSVGLMAQQSFPASAVTLVVPYSAGGGADFFARTVSAKMIEALGQTLVIDNKPGGNTAIAAADVARAKPDGYRLLLGDVATFSTNAALYKKLIYEPTKDFSSVSLAGRSPYLLLVNPRVHPYKTVAELVAAIRKAPPGTVTYGSAGNGGASHLAAEMFVRAAGVQMVHVPYKGSSAALPDLLGGQIGMMFMDYAPSKAQVTGGQLRALAVTSSQPSAALPDVPTMASLYPGFEAWFWMGISAPKGTPTAVIDKLRTAYVAAISDGPTRQKLLEAGIEPLHSSSAEMDAYILSEASRLGKLIAQAGIQLD